MRKVLSKVSKAILQWNLIEDGDTVAVGVSGGKDSLLLLLALKEFQKFNKIKFNLIGITIDPNIKGLDFSGVSDFCKKLEIPYFIEKTDIYDIVFNVRCEKNPCSLCAKMRRGALCDAAKKHGANKLALGHHQDDMIETFMLSLIYEGRFSTFNPKSLMTRTGITVIRPLLYLSEYEVKMKTRDLPVVTNPCPADKSSKRAEIKALLEDLRQKYPNIKENIFKSLTDKSRNQIDI